ncbi:hypothetical protein [Shimazuella kribbensis]|uniref:hypothetical protein n=1 Tax=Shimazuella kribbensis TaxID=139808 RepID=UPI0012EBA4D2|nr:hypothetical protein [Shimazuella kribbensis]
MEKQPVEPVVTKQDGQKSSRTFFSVRGMVNIAIFAAGFQLLHALFVSSGSPNVISLLVSAAFYTNAAIFASRFKPVNDFLQWAVYFGTLVTGSLYMIKAYSDVDMWGAVLSTVFVTGFGLFSCMVYLKRKR